MFSYYLAADLTNLYKKNPDQFVASRRPKNEGDTLSLYRFRPKNASLDEKYDYKQLVDNYKLPRSRATFSIIKEYTIDRTITTDLFSQL